MKYKLTIRTKENEICHDCPYPNDLEDCEDQIVELATDMENALSQYECYTEINNRTITVDIRECTKKDFVEWTKPIVNNYKCYLAVVEFEDLN